MRFHSKTLIILFLAATQHGSLALKGDSSALRLGAPRGLQVTMPPPKVPGTGAGTGEPNVPKIPPTQTTVGGNSSLGAEGEGTLPQVGMGTVPKDKTTEKGAVAPGGSTFKADGAPMPKESKDKAPKENKDCKKPKTPVSSRRRVQVGPTDKVPPTGTSGGTTTTTWTGANAGPAPGTTVDKSIEKAPKVGTGASPAMEPAIQPGSTTPETQQFTPMEPEETTTGGVGAPLQEGEQRFCLQSVVSQEQCAAVQGGELPADSQKASGTLTMELSSYNTADPEAALNMAAQILNAETPSKFIGCSQTFRKLQEGSEIEESTEEGEEVEPESDEPTYVTGLKIGEFKSTGDGQYNIGRFTILLTAVFVVPVTNTCSPTLS